jgi:hypothetical protein
MLAASFSCVGFSGVACGAFGRSNRYWISEEWVAIGQNPAPRTAAARCRHQTRSRRRARAEDACERVAEPIGAFPV